MMYTHFGQTFDALQVSGFRCGQTITLEVLSNAQSFDLLHDCHPHQLSLAQYLY